MIRAVLALIALSAAFVAGFLLGAPPEKPAEPSLACTPSYPHVAARVSDGPIVLMWGNSILHDHGWRIGDATAINCAVQGLTAARAASLVEEIPEVAPDWIVVALGSVELFRDATGRPSPNVDDFSAAIARNVVALKDRWPDARLILAAAPIFAVDGPDKTRLDPAKAAAINSAIQGVADREERFSFFDMSDVYQTAGFELPVEASYDGVHLTLAAYLRWEVALDAHLSSLR